MASPSTIDVAMLATKAVVALNSLGTTGLHFTFLLLALGMLGLGIFVTNYHLGVAPSGRE